VSLASGKKSGMMPSSFADGPDEKKETLSFFLAMLKEGFSLFFYTVVV